MCKFIKTPNIYFSSAPSKDSPDPEQAETPHHTRGLCDEEKMIRGLKYLK